MVEVERGREMDGIIGEGVLASRVLCVVVFNVRIIIGIERV